jgi:sterol desaturase/sphingolipid hydroxylase (fatty acid hydroxylase superfamily)
MLTAIWGQAVHLKANFSFGPLGWLLVSPNFHRIHHSRDRRHYDKNFAGMFSILDVVFGTAHFPARREQIDTGLDDKFEATTLTEYLIALRARR